MDGGIILASGSPRRSAILRGLGVKFRVVVPQADEVHYDDAPERTVLENARLKCAAVARDFPETPVLAADTVVVFEGRAIGKPADMAEARAMLRRFSGQRQDVFSGVAIRCGGQSRSWVEKSSVIFRQLSEKDIERYFELVNPLDKAGGYDIDCYGDLIISGYEGSFSNIMGLPRGSVMAALEEICG